MRHPQSMMYTPGPFIRAHPRPSAVKLTRLVASTKTPILSMSLTLLFLLTLQLPGLGKSKPEALALKLLKQSGVKGGLVVHVGCGELESGRVRLGFEAVVKVVVGVHNRIRSNVNEF